LYKKYGFLLACFVLLMLTTTAQQFFGTIRKEPLNSFLLNGLQASMDFLKAQGFDTLKKDRLVFEACYSKVESKSGELQMVCEAEALPVEQINYVRYAFTYKPMGDTLNGMFIDIRYMLKKPVTYDIPRDSNMLRLATALKNNTLTFGLKQLRRFIAQKKIRNPRISVHFSNRIFPNIADQITWHISKNGMLLYTLNGSDGKPVTNEAFMPPVIKEQ
jgi:hypothetical protein